MWLSWNIHTFLPWYITAVVLFILFLEIKIQYLLTCMTPCSRYLNSHSGNFFSHFYFLWFFHHFFSHVLLSINGNNLSNNSSDSTSNFSCNLLNNCMYTWWWSCYVPISISTFIFWLWRNSMLRLTLSWYICFRWFHNSIIITTNFLSFNSLQQKRRWCKIFYFSSDRVVRNSMTLRFSREFWKPLTTTRNTWRHTPYIWLSGGNMQHSISLVFWCSLLLFL